MTTRTTTRPLPATGEVATWTERESRQSLVELKRAWEARTGAKLRRKPVGASLLAKLLALPEFASKLA